MTFLKYIYGHYYLEYFRGRLLKSFPRSGTDILRQSSLLRSLRLLPKPEPSSSVYLSTVRGELRNISF